MCRGARGPAATTSSGVYPGVGGSSRREELSDGFPVQQTPNVILGSADVFGPAASLAPQNFFLKINMHDTEKYVRGAEGGGEMKRSFWEAVFAFGGGAFAGLADRILTNYHEGRAIAEPDETKMLLA